MNITVQTFSGKDIYCRPDTSWERENRDLYVPDNVSGYYFTPILFARISKAGKCIGEKFAARYYDAIGFGVLLYVADDLTSSRLSIAKASCHDHTSLLPHPLYNAITLENPDNEFAVKFDGKKVFSVKMEDLDGRKLIENALVNASAVVSQRTGDFVAIELSNMKKLVSDMKEGDVHKMQGFFCENDLFELKMTK